MDKVFETTRAFFQLPEDIKNRHPLNLDTMNGYSFPSDRYSDFTKENYDFNGPDTPLPDEYAPELRPSVNTLAPKLTQLAAHIFDMLSLALGI